MRTTYAIVFGLTACMTPNLSQAQRTLNAIDGELELNSMPNLFIRDNDRAETRRSFVQEVQEVTPATTDSHSPTASEIRAARRSPNFLKSYFSEENRAARSAAGQESVSPVPSPPPMEQPRLTLRNLRKRMGSVLMPNEGYKEFHGVNPQILL